MLVLIGDDSLPVHVLTANFIWTDWHNKTNGICPRREVQRAICGVVDGRRRVRHLKCELA